LKSENDILCFSASDTDCNGKTDIFDALRIAEFDAGIVKSLDCDNNDFAPDSAAGKMYRLEIAEGTGIYGSAVPGMFTLAFKDDGTYATTPETENVPPDQGAYTYTRVDGGSGKVTFTSTAMQGAVYTAVFTFTGEGAGTYAAVMTGKDGSEAGTFKGTFQEI